MVLTSGGSTRRAALVPPREPASWPRGAGEMARLVRGHDWRGTPLGPIEEWPPSLRIAVDLVLSSGYPTMLAWGPDFIQIYNDPLRPLAGSKHPAILGQPIRTAWPETWAVNGPVYTRVRRGETVTVEDMHMQLIRGDVLEEAWFTGSFSPVRDEGGEVAGVMVTVFDTTERVLATRALRAKEERDGFLLRLGDALLPIADAAEIERTATRLLGQGLGASRAFYASVAPDGDTLTIHRDFTEGVPSVSGTWSIAAFATKLEAEWRVGRTTAISNVGRDPRFSAAERAAFASVSAQAAVVVPLVKDDRLLALLGLVQACPREWTDAEVELIEEVARRTWDAGRRAETEAALRRRDAHQHVLLRLSDALRPISDPREVMGVACRLLGEALDADRVNYAEVEGDDYVVAEEHHRAGLAAMAGRYSIASFRPAERAAFEAGRTVAVADIEAEPELPPDQARTYAALDVRGFVSVPLVKRGALVVVLSVIRSRPGTWSTAEVELVEDVAERTWAAVERARSETARRDSEARYRRLFDAIDQGFCVIEMVVDARGRPVDYRFIEVNSAFERQTGLKAASGRTMRALEPEHEDFWFETYGRIARSGNPERFEAEASKLGRYYEVYAFPFGAQEEQRVGILFNDIRERRRAELALRESEERLRRFGEASSDVLWIRDAETLAWTYLSPAFQAVYGLSCETALAGDTFGNWLDLILPEDRLHAAEVIERVRRGERATFEYRVRRPSDGQVRLLRNTDFPIRDAAGRVIRIGGVGHDATEERAVELALEESGRRLRSLIEGIPQLVWRAVNGGRWTWSSPQWSDYTGLSQEESRDYGWLDAVSPEDHSAAWAAWEEAEARGGFDVEYRLCHASEQRYRWFRTRATAVRDEAGRIVEWLGTSTDIEDLRQLQARQSVLVAELQHRTKNLMGVIRSLGEQTLRSSTRLEDFAPRFRERIAALARANGLLSRLDEGGRVTFDELIGAELNALGDAAGAPGKIVLDGPKGIALRSTGVQTLALALHELATNALKYGAIAQPLGRLVVSWHVETEDGRPWLHVDWRESGVAIPDPDALAVGGGAGRQLIERALPYQLGARTTFQVEADGVHCMIALPASERGTRGEEAPG